MQQMKIRGVMVTRLMAFILVTFFALGAAYGQMQSAMQIQVPYKFTVGSKVLPAGTYSFSVKNNRLEVQSATGGTVLGIIITQISGPGEFLQGGSLVFDTTGGGHILSEVWIPGGDGQLLHITPKGHSRDVLLASYLNQSGTSTGKAAYNQTCGKCHGADGKGDADADKYFNTTIPRLSSADVQSKSDAELKQIITQGSSAMPPVEVDEAGFRHRLPPQDVDAVIAYVRTLKQ
jgi:mono/diheme cytochrome c family protein